MYHFPRKQRLYLFPKFLHLLNANRCSRPSKKIFLFANYICRKLKNPSPKYKIINYRTPIQSQ